MLRPTRDREPRTRDAWRSTAELADHLARVGFEWPARDRGPSALTARNHEVIGPAERPAVDGTR